MTYEMNETPDQLHGAFKAKDWQRIVKALQHYSECQSKELCQVNAGDREWDEVDCYASLARDIEFFVLPSNV